MEDSKTNFEILNETDLKGEVKKKGKHDYLPWATAWRIMKQHDPDAKVTEKEFEHYEVISGTHEDFLVKKMKPYQKGEQGSYVEVAVKMFGKEEKEIHAITDYSNKDIAVPSETQINKASKRAFVKALAKHGLGLYVYEGEDLPSMPKVTIKDLELLNKLLTKLASTMTEAGTDMDVKTLEKNMIARINKITKQDHDYLPPIKKIEEMTFEHCGLMKIEIQRGQEEMQKIKKA